MTDTPGTLEERLRYIGAILTANRHKFAVPDHIPAKVATLTEAADEIASLRAERDRHQKFSERRFVELTEALEREASLRARVESLEGALVDLMSWFPKKPSDPEWRIKGGVFGADDAVEHARSLIEKELDT